MGVVYRARDGKLDRAVAIKFLPRHVSSNPHAKQRFVIEAKAAAALNHPNIATVHAIEEHDGRTFIVMEYIEGRDLQSLVDAGPVAVDAVLDIAVQVAEGLNAAHAKGIVHRDIKPGNIMVLGSRRIKITDFGLAKVEAATQITQVGTTVGTVAYMSPEQARGEEVDHRSDIWSFGVLLYQMLTGRLPFQGGHDQASIYLILNEDPTPIAELEPAVPTNLSRVIERALQKDRERRYQSVMEMAADLEQGATIAHAVPAPAEQHAIVVRGELRAFGILMGDVSETKTRHAIGRARNAVVAKVKENGGRMIEAPGQSVVALFPDAASSLTCVTSMIAALADLNARLPATEKIHYRFGMDAGEVTQGPDGPGGAAVERAGDMACFAPTDGFDMTESFVETGAGQGATFPSGAAAGAGSADAPAPKQLESLDVPPPEEKSSIAILPFVAADETESAAIAEGLRIDITNALMKMKDIFLIAPSSMNHFRGASGPEVVARMGTRHLLEGNVRRSRDRVRVSVLLTDTATNSLTWSETFDRTLDDSFALQDEIAERVVTELDVKLAVGEQGRVWRKCLSHPKAREHFYQGLSEFFRSTSESVHTAQRCFQRVAELVPESPVGPTWTALSYWLQAAHGWTDDLERTRKEATAWAERAAAMEDADGQAHTVLGAVLLFERRYDEALAIARDSVFIRPGCNTANGILANVLLHCGHYDEAIVHAKRAIRIGPVYPPFFLEVLSSAYREAGKVDFAASVAREIIRLVPDTIHGRLLLISALVRDRWLAEARVVGRKVRELDESFSVDKYVAAQPYRSQRTLEQLRNELEEAGLTDTPGRRV